MKRCACRLLLFLLAGAIFNVAVAWGCAMWSKIHANTPRWLPPPQVGEHVAYLQSVGWRPLPMAADKSVKLSVWYGTGLGVSLRNVREEGEWLGAPRRQPLSVFREIISSRHVRAGWPLSALAGDLWQEVDDPFGPCRTRWAIKLPEAEYSRALLVRPALPLRPIWPGFEINTILYAALLWLLVFALRRTRRWRRIKRGLCPACAYPLGESPTCSECGGRLNVTSMRAGRMHGAAAPCNPR